MLAGVVVLPDDVEAAQAGALHEVHTIATIAGGKVACEA
jgi:hypothetical protein